MARRKATGRKKCLGKAYWGALAVKQGRARGSRKSLVDKCVRSCGASRDVCEKLVGAGFKGRRKAKGPGKRWGRRSTARQRALRKAFAAKARKGRGKGRSAFLRHMSGKLEKAAPSRKAPRRRRRRR